LHHLYVYNIERRILVKTGYRNRLKAQVLNNVDEAALVARCKQGSAVAQKEIFSQYAGETMILCLRYISHQEEAREVMMDSFMSFFKHIGSFTYRGEGSLRAWLRKIAVNQCLSHLRKKNHLTLSGKEPEYYEQLPSGDNILGQLTAKEIMHMIHALSPGYRAVFNMYVFDGMEHKEIAEVLGITESTSKSQLHRARAILKEKILQTN
jgi:RNA polymerase sigma-70 factor (ECF subfamily)